MSKSFWILSLWPSFIVAGVAEGIFFTLINPQELYLLGEPVRLSAVATYSIGFLAFWAVSAGSSMLTCFLQGKPNQVSGSSGQIA
jgi:hypothetical protein